MLINDYCDLWLARQFDWSSANCGHWAGGWVRMIEGKNPMDSVPSMEGIRGVVSRVLEYGSLTEMVTQHLARAPIDPKLAQVGDLVLLPSELSGSLAICNGRTAIGMSEFGITSAPMETAIAAWRVGEQ